ARAALDLTGAEDAPATLARNHRISHRDSAGLKNCTVLVGAALCRGGLRSSPNQCDITHK
ncbi:hypothetical protein EGJ15_11080, partial [Pseudomonas sp. p99-361]